MYIFEIYNPYNDQPCKQLKWCVLRLFGVQNQAQNHNPAVGYLGKYSTSERQADNLRDRTVWAATVLQNQRTGHGKEEVSEEHLMYTSIYLPANMSLSVMYLVHTTQKCHKNFFILAKVSVAPVHNA